MVVSSNEAQFISLIISVFAGLAVGLLFDLYRTINFYTRPKRQFLYFVDLLFWIITGIAVFAILLRAEFAQLRVYTFMGMLLGGFIYFKLFTEYILKFYRISIYFVTKFFRLLIIFIIMPFKLLRTLLYSPMSFVYRGVTDFFKSIVLSVKEIIFKKKK